MVEFFVIMTERFFQDFIFLPCTDIFSGGGVFTQKKGRKFSSIWEICYDTILFF